METFARKLKGEENFSTKRKRSILPLPRIGLHYWVLRRNVSHLREVENKRNGIPFFVPLEKFCNKRIILSRPHRSSLSYFFFLLHGLRFRISSTLWSEWTDRTSFKYWFSNIWQIFDRENYQLIISIVLSLLSYCCDPIIYEEQGLNIVFLEYCQYCDPIIYEQALNIIFWNIINIVIQWTFYCENTFIWTNFGYWWIPILWSNNIWTSFKYYFLEYCQCCEPINILLWGYFYINKLWILFFGILSMLWSNKYSIWTS